MQTFVFILLSYILQQFENGTLYISSVWLSDDGHYGCIVGNIRGFKRAEMKLTVQCKS